MELRGKGRGRTPPIKHRFSKHQEKVQTSSLPSKTVPSTALQSTLSLRLGNTMTRNSTRGCGMQQCEAPSGSDHKAPDLRRRRGLHMPQVAFCIRATSKMKPSLTDSEPILGI
uniref:Uncharacterized protein n=1 Tax=Knipowitschia caucasica TaxID=637954 RepID=A0AAV2LHI7_KNICA